MSAVNYPTHEQVVSIIADLVKEGLLVHNGKYRPGQHGELLPVYIHIRYATPEQIAKWGGKVIPQ